jgi:hypothetical protein
MSLRVIIVLVPLFFFNALHGKPVGDSILDSVQGTPKGQSLEFGLNSGWYAVRDNGTSPLIYKGFLPGAHIGVSIYHKQMVAFTDFNFYMGHLATRNYPELDGNKAKAYNSNLSFGMAHRLTSISTPKTSFFLGSSISVLANFRENEKFNNANFNYEGIASLGPLAIVEKEIKFSPKQLNLALFRWPFRDRTVKLSSSFFIPVLAGVSRPPYTTIDDFVDGVSPRFSLKKVKTVSLDKLFCLTSRSSISYYLHNGNKLMLSYIWYYYNYHPSANKVNSVSGSVSFSVVFRLNK